MPPSKEEPLDTLARLREIRDIQKEAVDLVPERDRLIREALVEGRSQSQVAKATGLTQARVSQVADL